jgi:hypothetical protein
VEHFLLSRRKVVDRLFEDVWSNTDESASNVAKAVMGRVTEFPSPERAELPAIDRKFCSDYTVRHDSA